MLRITKKQPLILKKGDFFSQWMTHIIIIGLLFIKNNVNCSDTAHAKKTIAQLKYDTTYSNDTVRIVVATVPQRFDKKTELQKQKNNLFHYEDDIEKLYINVTYMQLFLTEEKINVDQTIYNSDEKIVNYVNNIFYNDTLLLTKIIPKEKQENENFLLQCIVTEYRLALTDQKILNSDRNALSKKNKELLEEIAALKKEIAALQTANQDLILKNAQLTNLCNENINISNEKTRQIQELSQQIDQLPILDKENTELKKENTSLKDTNTALKSTIKELQKTCEKWATENISLQYKNKELTDINKNLSAQVEILAQKLKDLTEPPKSSDKPQPIEKPKLQDHTAQTVLPKARHTKLYYLIIAGVILFIANNFISIQIKLKI